MPHFIIHIAFAVALLLLQGCAVHYPMIDTASGASRDSVSVHVVDSYRHHMYLDSFILSVIHHDTTFRVERVVRELSQASSLIHDTTNVQKRDTVTIRQRPAEASSMSNIFSLIIIMIAAAFISIFVSSVWRR